MAYSFLETEGVGYGEEFLRTHTRYCLYVPLWWRFTSNQIWRSLQYLRKAGVQHGGGVANRQPLSVYVSRIRQSTLDAKVRCGDHLSAISSSSLTATSLRSP